MYKKIVLLAFVSALFLLATFGTQITLPVTSSTTHNIYSSLHSSLPVHNIDTGLNYSMIQGAINAPQTLDGHIIQVDTGTYYEHLVVNKTLVIIGENPANTIVDGNGTGIVVRIRASNVTIRGFTIQNGGKEMADCGIWVTNHTETISNNVIRNNYNGIWLLESNSSRIIDNTIVNNTSAGIYISDSNENIFYDNVIAYNTMGVWIAVAPIPNTFYHNNFLDNEYQVSGFGSARWDNGTEGNYWSDYRGVDTDGDGVGETELWHLGLDKYPLIVPTKPFPVIWDGTIYPVAVFSNSTVSGFYFSQPSKEIGFSVTGLLNKTGFCNVTIPLSLMWCSQLQEWQVNGDSPIYFPTPTSNGTHTFLYFTYNHTANTIRIISTEVIPEFPIVVILPLFIIVTLVTAVLRKVRKETSES